MAILINDTAPRNQYTATSGQTVFTVSFEFFENADLKVYKNAILQTITTHYTVTGAGVTGGGSITLTSGATAGDIITIVRDIPVKRVTDFPTSGPFNISALNTELDKIVAMVQEREDDITRVVQLADTDTSTSLTLPAAASRASKVLGFDATGNAIVMQELGNYRGNWAAGTAYVLRDIVKDTSNANIYICVQAHTSSGSQPLSTNANAASWALLIDGSSAAAAASSASAAASSASAAASSASAASGSASAASTSASNASTSATNASNSASGASTSATNAANSASSASTSATNAANSATSASGSATTATTQASNASSSASAAAASASTATTQASNASTSASNAASSASAAATSASNAASSASSASTSATSAAAAQSAAESARDATLAAYDNFDDRYLGAKTSNPSLDNDGNALVAGALYFNSVAGEMRLWTGSAWVAAYVSGSGFLSTSGGTITGDLVVSSSGSTDALRITQTGTGNALVVEDSANPDATPFIVDASGNLLTGIGTTALTLGGRIQASVGGATLSGLTTNTGSTSARTHWRLSVADAEVGGIGTSGTSMTFLTDATTRMTITDTGSTSITATGTGGVTGAGLTVNGTNLSGATTNVGVNVPATFGLGATVRGIGIQTTIATEAGGAGLGTASGFRAIQGTFGTAVTSQYGYWADSTITGGTYNYGFYSDIAAGTGRWNFYANGTADNYFAGDVGIGTSAPTARLNVVDATSQDAVRITQTGTGNALVVEDAANPDSTPFVINSTGNVVVGYTTPIFSSAIEAHSSGPFTGTRWNASNSLGPYLILARSRSGTIGTNLIVSSGDTLGQLDFRGDDGSSFLAAASVIGQVDGTPSLNDMPGRLVFSTTADGASTPTERMRIASAGQIGIGGANYGTAGQVLTSGGAAAAPSWQTISTTPPQLQSQTFGSSGTWTAPTGVTRAIVTLIGGGGGNSGFTSCFGGLGGNGGFLIAAVTVSPGTAYTVTIGAGGTGGAGTATGGTGGTTSFGALASATGGSGGIWSGAVTGASGTGTTTGTVIRNTYHAARGSLFDGTSYSNFTSGNQAAVAWSATSIYVAGSPGNGNFGNQGCGALGGGLMIQWVG